MQHLNLDDLPHRGEHTPRDTADTVAALVWCVPVSGAAELSRRANLRAQREPDPEDQVIAGFLSLALHRRSEGAQLEQIRTWLRRQFRAVAAGQDPPLSWP